MYRRIFRIRLLKQSYWGNFYSKKNSVEDLIYIKKGSPSRVFYRKETSGRVVSLLWKEDDSMERRFFKGLLQKQDLQLNTFGKDFNEKRPFKGLLIKNTFKTFRLRVALWKSSIESDACWSRRQKEPWKVFFFWKGINLKGLLSKECPRK